MGKSFAVLWSDGDTVRTGRLERYRDRLELHGRDGDLVVPFADVEEAAIARGHAERLRGLPVLAIVRRGGSRVRVASLDGPGVLHELARHPGLSSVAVS